MFGYKLMEGNASANQSLSWKQLTISWSVLTALKVLTTGMVNVSTISVPTGRYQGQEQAFDARPCHPKADITAFRL